MWRLTNQVVSKNVSPQIGPDLRFRISDLDFPTLGRLAVALHIEGALR